MTAEYECTGCQNRRENCTCDYSQREQQHEEMIEMLKKIHEVLEQIAESVACD